MKHDMSKGADYECHLRLKKLKLSLIWPRGHAKEIFEYMGLKL